MIVFHHSYKESGAGKTTLLKIISGHAQATSGTILFDGTGIIEPDEKLLPEYKQIAYYHSIMSC